MASDGSENAVLPQQYQSQSGPSTNGQGTKSDGPHNHARRWPAPMELAPGKSRVGVAWAA